MALQLGRLQRTARRDEQSFSELHTQLSQLWPSLLPGSSAARFSVLPSTVPVTTQLENQPPSKGACLRPWQHLNAIQLRMIFLCRVGTMTRHSRVTNFTSLCDRCVSNLSFPPLEALLRRLHRLGHTLARCNAGHKPQNRPKNKQSTADKCF